MLFTTKERIAFYKEVNTVISRMQRREEENDIAG